MSPEERADAICAALSKESWKWREDARWLWDDATLAAIASVIRAAENDALERAAGACDAVEKDADGNSAEQAGASDCADAIRALKHQEPSA